MLLPVLLWSSHLGFLLLPVSRSCDCLHVFHLPSVNVYSSSSPSSSSLCMFLLFLEVNLLYVPSVWDFLLTMFCTNLCPESIFWSWKLYVFVPLLKTKQVNRGRGYNSDIELHSLSLGRHPRPQKTTMTQTWRLCLDLTVTTWTKWPSSLEHDFRDAALQTTTITWTWQWRGTRP